MRAPNPNSDLSMHQHPLLDSLAVVGVSAIGILTNEKTLIFMGICFTALRMYLAWRNRNKPRKGDDE